MILHCTKSHRLKLILAVAGLAALAACSGGGGGGGGLAFLALAGGGGSAPAPVTVGGVVSGLNPGEEVVLTNNGGDSRTITANGPFTFTELHSVGQSYNVQVFSTTAPACTAGRNSGTVGMSDVTDVSVVCGTPRTLRVQVTNLNAGPSLGAGLVFRNNGADDTAVTAFTTPTSFSVPVVQGANYSVSVLSQPSAPNQVCSPVTATDANGTMPAATHTVTFGCSTTFYTVSAAVSGLASGNSVVLRNNGGNDLLASANGSHSFTTPVAAGLGYSVTVFSQPTAPNQTCAVSGGGNGSGGGSITANTTVTVACTTNQYTVGGTISGLSSGESITLQVNGGGNVTISHPSTAFSFSLPDESAYTVTVLSRPATKGCYVSNGTGTLAGANVSNVTVTCGVCIGGGGNKSINVSWTASRSYEVNTASGGGHRIYYDAQTGVTATTPNTVNVPNTTSTTNGTITGLWPGCTYYVRVRAYSSLNATGGDLSPESSVSIPL